MIEWMLTPLDRRSLRVTHGGSSREPSRSYLYGQELSRAVGLGWSHTIRTLLLSLAIVAISLYHFASSDMCIIPSHLHLEQGVLYHLSSLSSFKISWLRRRKKTAVDGEVLDLQRFDNDVLLLVKELIFMFVWYVQHRWTSRNILVAHVQPEDQEIPLAGEFGSLAPYD
jgi:hypothetical protein